VNDSTWTWVSGSNDSSAPPVYGEKGVPDSANAPGARRSVAGWYDRTRKEFWLFGGRGRDNTSQSGASFI